MTPDVVVMAGGRGLRLHPLTATTPKPLIKVGSKPILQTIIEGYAKQGVDRFVLCLNYKADLIETYFQDGSKLGVTIQYVREQDFLGTAGALRLLPMMPNPFIVTNADVLANVDVADLMKAHSSDDRDATMCLALHQYQVPYGVVESDGSIREKPIESWSVNAGIYVISPNLVADMPHGPMDMPELLSRGRVGTYQIEGPWTDVGNFVDLSRAQAMAAE